MYSYMRSIVYLIYVNKTIRIYYYVVIEYYKLLHSYYHAVRLYKWINSFIGNYHANAELVSCRKLTEDVLGMWGVAICNTICYHIVIIFFHSSRHNLTFLPLQNDIFRNVSATTFKSTQIKHSETIKIEYRNIPFLV